MTKLRQKTDYMPLFDERLRDYQREGQLKVRKSFMRGNKRVLLEMATGCGKTMTAVTLPKEGSRSLFVVGMLTLVRQAVNSISRFRDVEPDVEQASFRADGGAPWTVASWQSLSRNNRYKKYIGNVDLIVVDEAHHLYTPGNLAILNELVEGGARVLGMSATAYRSDSQSLLGFYDECAFTYSMRDGIRDGYLVGPKAQCHYVSSVDLSGVKRSGNDFAQDELDRILRTEGALHEIARLFKDQHVRGEKAVLFAHSIRQAEALRQILGDRYGVSASLVHSKMAGGQSSEELQDFMDGDNELIVNVGVLTTGWDYDRLSEIFIAKPTKSLSKYVQMVGRGTRTLDGVLGDLTTREERLAAIAASGKPHFRIHDITDSSRCHQVKTIHEVLAEGNVSKSVAARIRRRCEEEAMDIDELDAALAEEMEADRQAAAVLREARRKQRQGDVLGMEFESESVDIIGGKPDRDTPHRREWYSPLKHGKYARQPLRKIDLGYLRWMRDKANLGSFWKKVITDHINFRESMGRLDQERRA